MARTFRTDRRRWNRLIAREFGDKKKGEKSSTYLSPDEHPWCNTPFSGRLFHPVPPPPTQPSPLVDYYARLVAETPFTRSPGAGRTEKRLISRITCANLGVRVFPFLLPYHWFPFDNEYRTLCDRGGGGGGLRGSAHTTRYTRVFSGDVEGDCVGDAEFILLPSLCIVCNV